MTSVAICALIWNKGLRQQCVRYLNLCSGICIVYFAQGWHWFLVLVGISFHNVISEKLLNMVSLGKNEKREERKVPKNQQNEYERLVRRNSIRNLFICLQTTPPCLHGAISLESIVNLVLPHGPSGLDLRDLLMTGEPGIFFELTAEYWSFNIY